MIKENIKWQLKRNLPQFILFSILNLIAPVLMLLAFLEPIKNGALVLTETAPWYFCYLISYIVNFIWINIIIKRLYGYMHKRNAVDTINTIPIKRSTFFDALNLTAATLLAGAIILRALLTILGLFYLAPAYSNEYLYNVIWEHLSLLVFCYAYYAFALLIHCWVGKSSDGTLLALAYNMAVPAIVIGYFLYRDLLWPRLVSNLFVTSDTLKQLLNALLYVCPVPIAAGFSVILNHSNIIYWLFIGTAFLCLARFFFIRRPAERAETSAAQSPFFYIIATLVVLTFAMFFGGIMAIMLGSLRYVSLVLGGIIGGSLSYLTLIIIFIRNKNKWRQTLPVLIVPIAIFSLILAGVKYNFAGMVVPHIEAGSTHRITLIDQNKIEATFSRPEEIAYWIKVYKLCHSYDYTDNLNERLYLLRDSSEELSMKADSTRRRMDIIYTKEILRKAGTMPPRVKDYIALRGKLKTGLAFVITDGKFIKHLDIEDDNSMFNSLLEDLESRRLKTPTISDELSEATSVEKAQIRLLLLEYKGDKNFYSSLSEIRRILNAYYDDLMGLELEENASKKKKEPNDWKEGSFPVEGWQVAEAIKYPVDSKIGKYFRKIFSVWG